MENKSLFRAEALAAPQLAYYGSVFINTPWQYRFISVAGLGCLFGMACLLYCGEFAEQCLVKGYLNVDCGITQIYASQAGIVRRQYVKHGDHVQRGDRLLTIDRAIDNDAILQQLRIKQRLLDKTIHQKQQLLQELKTLRKKKYIAITTYQTKLDEISTLQQQKSQLAIDYIHSQQSRTYTVRAPKNGIIAHLFYHSGQSVSMTKPLLNILPEKMHFIAELTVPAVKARFLTDKQSIQIRYDAYPYQQFGVATGQIVTISQALISDKEEDKPFAMGQPYYKAQAHLTRQTIVVNGQPQALLQGMTLTAILTGPRKKLWQWIMGGMR